MFGDAKVFGNAQVSGKEDIIWITGLGRVHRTTTAFRMKTDEMVRYGCFFGNNAEFREQVSNTRKGKIANEYLKLAELIEIYFEIESKENEDV